MLALLIFIWVHNFFLKITLMIKPINSKSIFCPKWLLSKYYLSFEINFKELSQINKIYLPLTLIVMMANQKQNFLFYGTVEAEVEGA